MNGIFMEYEWIIHRIFMDYSWNIHGLFMDYSWTSHGICLWGCNGTMMGYPQTKWVLNGKEWNSMGEASDSMGDCPLPCLITKGDCQTCWSPKTAWLILRTCQTYVSLNLKDWLLFLFQIQNDPQPTNVKKRRTSTLSTQNRHAQKTCVYIL